MTARQLEITINDQLVGYLREINDLWELEYSADWMASAQAFDLSPALPRGERLHADGATHRPVQWYFDNLLPEEALRTAVAKEAELSAEDAFGLLAYYGAESAGSLVLRDTEKPASTQSGLRPLPLTELSQRITDLPKASFNKDAPKKMSLAGAQHKLLIVLNGDQLFEPLASTPSTHILKPNHTLIDTYPASVVNEYFTMRLAKAVGLEVPTVRRMYVPQPVYIVERFDRVRTEDAQAVQRRHLIDMCQLLSRARTFKYSGANLVTLAASINLCRSRTAARLQLYRWIIFNVLVGNADNHLKNVSFLVERSGINLAPAYDLLCTAVYETRAVANERATWPETHFAIPLGDARTFAQVTRDHVLDAGHALGLADATAQRLLDGLIESVPAEAEKLIEDIRADSDREVAISPDPEVARTYIAGEMRLIRATKHIVLAEMAERLG